MRRFLIAYYIVIGSGTIKEKEGELAHPKNKKSRWKTLTHKKHGVEFVGVSKKGIKCLTK